MPSVARAAVPVVRDFLDRLGISRVVVKDDGEIDVSGLVGETVREIEFRSNVTPPFVVQLPRTGAAPHLFEPETGEAAPATRTLALLAAERTRPSVRVRGIAGEQRFAPFGEPSPDQWRRTLAAGGIAAGGTLLAAFAVGYVTGAALRQRRLLRVLPRLRRAKEPLR